MYHANPARTGFVADTPNPQHLTDVWRQRLDGAVYAEPLVVNGLVIVATEHDTLYALDAHSGQVQWHTNVGVPVPLNTLPCGNIDPLGITGTPVYDPQTSLVFAVAEITGPTHILVGLDVQTGDIKVRRSVEVAGESPRTHQERAALALYRDKVYVAYGGLAGDCGAYHGKVVASRTDGTGDLLVYQVPTANEAGIWATPGPVILEDAFAPTSWPQDNAADADLGSMAPVLLPDGLIYANGKSTQGYLLRATHLGGLGGQIQTLRTCEVYGGAAVSGQSFFLPCTDGLHQVTLTAGPGVTFGWHAPWPIVGSPVVGGQTVYSLDPYGGVLYALNVATGQVRAQISVGRLTRFATPTLYQTTVIVGTMEGVVAVTIA
jgi:outer membrane protein assembly factor BamB